MYRIQEVQRDAGLRYVEYHETLDSTSRLAEQLFPALVAESPSLVLTADQTNGRGRGNHSWWAGRGALTFSLVLERSQLQVPEERWASISLAVGLGVHDAIRPLVGERLVQLKWPNDVMLQGLKLGGILVQNLERDDAAGLIIGIGLNLNNSLQDAPQELRERAVSLFDLTGLSLDLSAVLIQVITCVRSRMQQLSKDPLGMVREFDEAAFLNGRVVRVECGVGVNAVSGICQGIDETGALLLATETGLTRVSSGTVARWSEDGV